MTQLLSERIWEFFSLASRFSLSATSCKTNTRFLTTNFLIADWLLVDTQFRTDKTTDNEKFKTIEII